MRRIENGQQTMRNDGRRVAGGGGGFALYVEGPRDQEILRSWARRVSRPLERAIDASTVIMGGRQPARAVEHFRRELERGVELRELEELLRRAGREPPALRAASQLPFRAELRNPFPHFCF